MSKMSKRFVSCVLAVAMMTSLAPSTAFATDGSTESVSSTTENSEQSANGNVAKIGEQEYATLQAAVKAAPKDGTETTIELISDTEIAAPITIEKDQNIIINANEKTLTVSSSFSTRFFTNYGTLTLTGNGTFDATNAGANGNGTVNNFGTLTVIDGTYKNPKESDASNFYNRNGGTATFVNPTINGGGGCVATAANTTTTIQGGSYTNETYPAIENRGNMLITGGTFTNTSCSSCSGKWGYTIRSGESSDTAYLKIQGVDDNSVTVTGVQGGLAVIGGTADIYNGTYKTIPCTTHGGASAFYAGYFTGESYKTSTNIYGGSFTSCSKTAILVGNGNPAPDSGAGESSTVMIFGGTFTGGDAAKTAITVNKTEYAIGAATIFGGTFSSNPETYVKEGYEATQSGENWIVTAKEPVAQIGDTQYTSVADAIKAAGSGDTITLLKDVSIDSTIEINKNIEIAGDNHTITANGCAGLYIKQDLDSLNIHDLTLKGSTTKDTVGETMDGEPFMGLGTYNGCYGVKDLKLSNVTIDGFTYGLYFGKNPAGNSADSSDVDVVINANNLIIQNSYIKGLYAEKLTNSTFNNCQFIDNGKDTSKVDPSLQTWMCGVDINLKNGSYQNINFTDCTFTGNGQNRGTALHIKARNDGNYGIDTKLDGVTISDCTFTDNNAVDTGNNSAAFGPIVLGEPGKNNPTPVNVTIQNDVTVTNNLASVSTITFNANEGNCTVGQMIVAKDGSITTLPTPTRDGYTFDGWFTAKDGGDKVTTETFFKEDTTLYAHWTKNSSGGGTVTPTPDPEEPSDSEETVTNPDGSTTTTITKEDGSSSTTTVGTDGKVESDVTVSEEAVSNADGAAVALPIPEVPVTTDKDAAPTVTVNLPSKDATKVEVPVKDVTPGTVAVLVDADGNETVIKDTVQSENGIIVEITDGTTIKVVDNSKSFDDVTDNYWGADAIDFATSRELFAGTGENTFSPEGDMTRAMIWSVLARYEGADTSGASGDEWYAGPQKWAIENGISDGTYPNASMTREQLAAMLYRYVGSPAVSGTVGDYSDADSISSWASDAMVWAVQQGLIAGMGENTLNPQGTATRTQVAAILQRFIENKMA